MIDWNQTYKDGRDYRASHPVFIDAVIKELGARPGDRAVDVGCGTGDLARKLTRKGLDVTAIDPSSEAIRIARSTSPNTIMFEVNNAADIKADSYKWTVSKLVVAFVEDQAAFLKQLKNITQDGGAVVIITPVRFPDIEYGSKYNNISVDHAAFMTLCGTIFENAQEFHRDYIDESACTCTFILA